MSLGVRYVHKWVDYAIEAICVPVPTGEDCGVNNPGFGEGEFPLGRDLPAQPAAERIHDGIEVRLRKRFANRWSMDASYLLVHLRGNWSGLASSDEAVERTAACSSTPAARSTCSTTRTTRRDVRATACSPPIARISSSAR